VRVIVHLSTCLDLQRSGALPTVSARLLGLLVVLDCGEDGSLDPRLERAPLLGGRDSGSLVEVVGDLVGDVTHAGRSSATRSL
jgi:hypothetical protein